MTQAEMTRLVLDAGRRRGVRPGDIVKSIATDAGIPGSDIGNIDVQADATFIEVRSTVASKILERAAVVTLRGGDANLSLARPKDPKGKRAPEERAPYVARTQGKGKR